MSELLDVAIVGGGPAGSTLGSFLKKYRPDLAVSIFEREIFPREHVGESLLPTVGRILDETGAWEAVEAAGFPIKIGATYKWGVSDDLWDFNLLDTAEVIEDAPRPAKYEGWRMRSAFQVDRAKFDKILLDRAAELGCQIHEDAKVTTVHSSGDRIDGLTLQDGRKITARLFVDASGGAAVLRKAMKVEVEEPASLKNIAVWDYWEDAEWAVTIGAGGTRVQVTSLPNGWLWFIPISPTRTSIGLVCPAEFYKKSGKSVEVLYREAVVADARIAGLIEKAKPDNDIRATKDWSFLAGRMTGENWFLIGESAGFADPILAAGLTMTMVGAKECAFSILELQRNELDATWLKSAFQSRQKQRINQHIAFANYWYTANAHFTDLMEYTSEIARQAGYKLDAKSAWQWLGTGGFVSLETAGAGLAGHGLEHIKNLQRMMFSEESEWMITRVNVFELALEGAQLEKLPVYHEGRVRVGKVLRREGKELPFTGALKMALEILQTETTLSGLIQKLRGITTQSGPAIALNVIEAFETLLKDGWITGSYDPLQPLLHSSDIPRTPNVNWNKDETDPKVKIGGHAV